MEKVYFDKIFDFSNSRAIKLQNTSYLEELTGLFSEVASRLDEGREYCFDDQYYINKHRFEPNTSYSEFIESFKTSFFHGGNGRIHIIRGRAGVGKTLFFNKGIQKLLRNKTEHKEKYIPISVDFKNIDSEETIEYYCNFIYRTLYTKSRDAIRILGGDYEKSFIKQYNEFKNTSDDFDTTYTKLFPLLFFCKKIYNKYDRPCIIVFDNIDLASVNTQRNVFRATAIVCEELYSFMETYKFAKYCIYFAMRPETFLQREEARLGKAINFPLPNILKISLHTIKKNLLKVAKEFDEDGKLKCEVDYYSIISGEKQHASTFTDIANYFNSVLTHHLEDLWHNSSSLIQRLGTCEEFHCNICNYNVRSFLIFFADTLSNGGFKPLTTQFNNSSNSHYYSVFDYIEMIIKGRWIVHPGNKYIDSEGGNKAPIIFNVFDTDIWTNTQENKIKHFMLYIRILQYFSLCSNEEKIFYSELEDALSPFFDKKHIINALKKLIHVRIIYSLTQGDSNISSIRYWGDVPIEKSTELEISPTGVFYLQKLICEFEYLYQMALSSIMPQQYTSELSNKWNSDKELTVLYFLTGIFIILQKNIKSYDEDTLEKFINIFCQDNAICQPYRRMLKSFINVMENKIQRAENKDIDNIDRLLDILHKAQELKQNAESFFSHNLGEYICL